MTQKISLLVTAGARADLGQEVSYQHLNFPNYIFSIILVSSVGSGTIEASLSERLGRLVKAMDSRGSYIFQNTNFGNDSGGA